MKVVNVNPVKSSLNIVVYPYGEQCIAQKINYLP